MSKFGINVDVFCQKIHTYLREEIESNLRLFFFSKRIDLDNASNQIANRTSLVTTG